WIRLRHAVPFVIVGLAWFLGMLVPTIGLVQIADASHADRYTYLPQIGLLIAVAWGMAHLAKRMVAPAPRHWLTAVAFLPVVLLAVAGHRQTSYWRTDGTLWAHAVECDAENVHAQCSLATALEGSNDADAKSHYEQALELITARAHEEESLRAKANNGLGNIALRQGDLAEAIAQYEQAVELTPPTSQAAGFEMNLGRALTKAGEFDDALAHFQRILELDPAAAPLAYRSMGIALAEQGNLDAAIAKLEEAVRLDPGLGIGHVTLGLVLARHGDAEDAIGHFRRAIALDPFVAYPTYPDVAFPYLKLAGLLHEQGRTAEAADCEREAVAVRRKHAAALAGQ
ncbi:MAG TPA: tetratricopeptide repeat protein, partial [Pirellulales bacterium]|nr:tetratricopeptide repeat protein [Pirellulales bacterium]